MSNDTTTAPVDKYAGKSCLVVSREDLDRTTKALAGGPFQGFTSRSNIEMLTCLLANAKFVDQGPAEKDPSLKQLIPYCVVHTHDRILSYSRTKKGTEARLHDKRSIGVGGHIEPVDMPHGISLTGLVDSLYREVEEEIGCLRESILNITLGGFVNNDGDEVGSVHLGVVFYVLVNGEDALGQIEPHLSTPVWEDPADLLKQTEPALYDKLEAWSQMVVDKGLPSETIMLGASVVKGSLRESVLTSADSVIKHFGILDEDGEANLMKAMSTQADLDEVSFNPGKLRDYQQRAIDELGAARSQRDNWGVVPNRPWIKIMPPDQRPVQTVGQLDRKFVFEAVNPANGHVYDHNNAFVICAHDVAAPAALRGYLEHLESNHGGEETLQHRESIGLLLARVEEFQRANGGRVPDTKGAEVTRCITGTPAWSNDTEPVRPAHQQRVIDEARELGGNWKRLCIFIDDENPIYAGLPDEEKTRLQRQADLQGQLLAVLGERIEAFPAL